MKCYCLYDRVAMVHGESGLFLQRSDEVAKRSMKSALLSKALPPQVLDYPGDFDLICLGDLDQKSGLFNSSIETVVNLGSLRGDNDV